MRCPADYNPTPVTEVPDSGEYTPKFSIVTRKHLVTMKFDDSNDEGNTTLFQTSSELAGILRRQASITVTHKITVTRYTEHQFRMYS